jgi:CO/xanthine dehydrogenase FAD-binding subunit
LTFSQPHKVDEALSFQTIDAWSILSGGMDCYPAMVETRPSCNVLDISKLELLRSIIQDEDHWHIGALIIWSDVISADLPAEFDALKIAGRECGSMQIQNRATVIRNLCNASPMADGISPLPCLDAVVQLFSAIGTRKIALAEFIKGYHRTAMRPDAMIADHLISKKSAGVGSCSEVAKRLDKLEAALIGKKFDANFSTLVERHHFDCRSPIDDVRASGSNCIYVTQKLVSHSLSELAGGPLC